MTEVTVTPFEPVTITGGPDEDSNDTIVVLSDFIPTPGPQGEQGEQGIQGPEGPVGPVGPKGDVGASGTDPTKVLKTGDEMTGDLTISKANSLLILNKSASAQFTSIRGNLNGVRRWAMFLGGTAVESGGNTGSEFSINRYTDTGTALGAALTIDRATGDVTIPSALHVGPLIQRPAASATPANNGDVMFELTNNTQLKIKVKGSDGIVRSATLTLA